MPFRVRNVAVTDSTNDDAAALLGAFASGPPASDDGAPPGDPAGLVIVADYQRAGRGRHARAWVAPAGSSLLFTAILPRPVASAHLWAATFWTALGVADGLASATGLHVDLQWPNDLLLDRRKCGGILCVSRVGGDVAWVACGVGLNVSRPAGDPALAAIEPAPAFVSDFVADVPSRERVLRAILDAFERRLPELDDPRGIARAWERRARLDGTPYRLLVDGETHPLDATARRIDDDGALVVLDRGRERAIALADARVLR